MNAINLPLLREIAMDRDSNIRPGDFILSASARYTYVYMYLSMYVHIYIFMYIYMCI
jgi:hypothetical protein